VSVVCCQVEVSASGPITRVDEFYSAFETWWHTRRNQIPDFVFRRNGRIHLNRQKCQFSRLLAAEVCASAVVMLDTPCSEVVCEYWLPTPFASFPFTSLPVRHRVPSGFKRAPPSVMCIECEREVSTVRRSWPTRGCPTMSKK
jgi:hypothetical protein